MGQGMGEPSDERMPKKVNRLSAVKVVSTKQPGFYADGGGLYLQITDSGSRSWVFRFKVGGRTRDMGLGSLNTVGLAEARGMAAECRRQRLQGVDPIEARKSERAQAFSHCFRCLSFAHAALWEIINLFLQSSNVIERAASSCEQTNFPREVAEAALAHVIADRTEAAYRRGDLFEKRRSLMAAWAAYCQMESSVGAAVIPMKGTKAL
jgi:Arm DNA-binding domain